MSGSARADIFSLSGISTLLKNMAKWRFILWSLPLPKLDKVCHKSLHLKKIRSYKALKCVQDLGKVCPSYDPSCMIFSSFNFMVISNIASADIAESWLIKDGAADCFDNAKTKLSNHSFSWEICLAILLQCRPVLRHWCYNPKEIEGKTLFSWSGIEKSRLHLFYCQNSQQCHL